MFNMFLKSIDENNIKSINVRASDFQARVSPGGLVRNQVRVSPGGLVRNQSRVSPEGLVRNQTRVSPGSPLYLRLWCMYALHSSAIFHSPPTAVVFFCSCDKVYRKQEVRFLLYLLGPSVTTV